jgi:signal transduction histidine kinase
MTQWGAAVLAIGSLAALVFGQRGAAAACGLLAGVLGLLAARARHRATAASLAAAEAQSQAWRALLGAVVDSVDAGVLVLDDNGGVLARNAAAEVMLEAGVSLPLARALRGEDAGPADVVVHPGLPDARTLRVCARPLPATAGRAGAVATIHDITDRAAADARAEATISDLRAFARVAAHDLKSPLTAVAGFAELLEDSLRAGADPTALRPTAARLVTGIDRMHRLVEDILVYATARDGRIDPQPVDLNAVVTDVIAERTAHLRSGSGGDSQPFPDIYVGPLPVVHADPAMTRQLLDNLVGNAIKYTLPGRPARIDISAHARQGDQGWIRVEIADRGIGIPAADKPHIFTSYHRSTEHTHSYTGTGLGLAICQRITERHGGRIGVSDNPGGGTRFWFTMPTAAADGPAATPVAAVARTAAPAAG